MRENFKSAKYKPGKNSNVYGSTVAVHTVNVLCIRTIATCNWAGLCSVMPNKANSICHPIVWLHYALKVLSGELLPKESQACEPVHGRHRICLTCLLRLQLFLGLERCGIYLMVATFWDMHTHALLSVYYIVWALWAKLTKRSVLTAFMRVHYVYKTVWTPWKTLSSVDQLVIITVPNVPFLGERNFGMAA